MPATNSPLNGKHVSVFSNGLKDPRTLSFKFDLASPNEYECPCQSAGTSQPREEPIDVFRSPSSLPLRPKPPEVDYLGSTRKIFRWTYYCVRRVSSHPKVDTTKSHEFGATALRHWSRISPSHSCFSFVIRTNIIIIWPPLFFHSLDRHSAGVERPTPLCGVLIRNHTLLAQGNRGQSDTKYYVVATSQPPLGNMIHSTCLHHRAKT